jgi:hypothetical protein
MSTLIEDFVNYQQERDTFWKMLRREIEPRVLLVHGRGGVGKSYLLDEFRAECIAEAIACVRINFAETAGRNFMALMLSAWDQLGLGPVEDLAQIVATTRLVGAWETMPTRVVSAAPAHIPAAGARAPAHTPQAAPSASAAVTLDRSGGVDIYNSNVSVGGDLVGRDKIANFFAQFTMRDDALVQQMIQASSTRLLQARLSELAATRPLAVLLDAWEYATTETQAWLRRELLAWIINQQLPGAVAVVAGRSVPEIHRLQRRVIQLHLDGLSDEATRVYWVEKCNLPPEALPDVRGIASGLPLALALAAQQQAKDGSAIRVPERAGATAGTPEIIRSTVEGLLATFPLEIAAAIRLAAIPHWVDRDLLGALLPNRSLTERVLTCLGELPFVRQDEQGHLRLHDAVRAYLWVWCLRQQPGQYEEANRAALHHFRALADTATSAELAVYHLEILYHLLSVDQREGIRYLRERFEDACGQHQFSLAERFVNQAAQRTVVLTGEGRLWIDYFRARLEMVYARDDHGQTALKELAARSRDTLLSALINWSLSKIMVDQQRWTQAIRGYHICRAALSRKREPAYAARLLLDLGAAYNDLAEASGGLRAERRHPFARSGRGFHTLQHLPFLLYELLVRHVGFLPHWYVGTNYHDWTIAFLLEVSARWYRQAERQYQALGDEQGVVDARLCLAELDHALGRWSWARRGYALLREAEPIRSSLYRTARVQLGQGRAALDERDAARAEVLLSEALDVFRHFQDLRSVGVAAELLGRSYVARGRTDDAVRAFIESAQAFSAVGDLFARTEVIWALEAFAERNTLPADC